MACLTELTLDQAQRVASEYGLTVERVVPLEAGSVNSNFRLERAGLAPVFGRIYEEQGVAGAEAEIRLLGELAALGVPTTAPLARHDGALVGSVDGKPFALYPWVEGEWLCHQRLTPAHCRALGQALAQVHLATSQLTHVPQGRFGMPQIRERLAYVRSATNRFDGDVATIEHGINHYESTRDRTLPTGLVHGDLFRDNVLWPLQASRVGLTPGSTEIAALLDFESASHGVFVYDLMVCVLSWCFTDALELARVHALLDGYESLRPLTARERVATSVEGLAVCLRFATTRITDFAMRTPEGVVPKRDYRRFLVRYEAIKGGAMDRLWLDRGRV